MDVVSIFIPLPPPPDGTFVSWDDDIVFVPLLSFVWLLFIVQLFLFLLFQIAVSLVDGDVCGGEGVDSDTDAQLTLLYRSSACVCRDRWLTAVANKKKMIIMYIGDELCVLCIVGLCLVWIVIECRDNK